MLSGIARHQRSAAESDKWNPQYMQKLIDIPYVSVYRPFQAFSSLHNSSSVIAGFLVFSVPSIFASM